LDRRGFLMTTPKAPGWEIPQRLAGYALAFRAFETIEAAVAGMVQVAPEDLESSLALAPNSARSATRDRRVRRAARGAQATSGSVLHRRRGAGP
jgi:hypothetical protein